MKNLKSHLERAGKPLTRDQLKAVVGGMIPCGGYGDSCDTDADCCEGIYCVSGICLNEYAKACEGLAAGSSCFVNGKSGYCGYGGTGPLVCFT